MEIWSHIIHHYFIQDYQKINVNGYVKQNDTVNPSGIASTASGIGNTIQIFAQSLELNDRATIQTLAEGEGNAGDIFINVNDLQITGGADIDASNEGTGTGKAGNININAENSVFITATRGIDTDNRFVVKDGYLGGIYSSANKKGTGGDITLTTKYLTMSDGGVISVGSQGKGDAGNINLNINDRLTMNNAAILTKSIQSGGNATINSQKFITLNKSQILANAINKQGGNINVKSDLFIPSSNSILNASSKLGIDGKITIDAPDTDFTGSLKILPTTFVDISTLLRDSCTTDRSSFFLGKRTGLSEVFLKNNNPVY
ncbi:hypothetical protein QUF74_19570 [Candidatus Halobeggiatoa sp. HSG11]|nr:hypothetical protein [Candidatus Halobeggiatoa sp. HSG11]